jgi:hypothetical protein
MFNAAGNPRNRTHIETGRPSMLGHEKIPQRGFLKTWVPILIGLGGVLSGVGTFYYQNIYMPEHLPRPLSVSSSLEKVGENSSFIALKGTFKVKNISKERSDVLAAYYNVWGIKIAPNDDKDTGDTVFSKYVSRHIADDTQSPTFARHSSEISRTPILVSRYWGEREQAWFDTGLEYPIEYHVFVPPGKYDLVRAEVWLFYTKLRSRKQVSAMWFAADNGEIWARPCKKLAGFEADPAKCDPLDDTT